MPGRGVTEYAAPHSDIIVTGCLAPHGAMDVISAKRPHVFHGHVVSMWVKPYNVRFEITHEGCKHPVMLDATLGYDGTAA